MNDKQLYTNLCLVEPALKAQYNSAHGNAMGRERTRYICALKGQHIVENKYIALSGRRFTLGHLFNPRRCHWAEIFMAFSHNPNSSSFYLLFEYFNGNFGMTATFAMRGGRKTRRVVAEQKQNAVIIPLGMCLLVEKSTSYQPASRQGCIPNGMQKHDISSISTTERTIPDGMSLKRSRREHTHLSSSLRLLYQAKPRAQTCLRSRLTMCNE